MGIFVQMPAGETILDKTRQVGEIFECSVSDNESKLLIPQGYASERLKNITKLLTLLPKLDWHLNKWSTCRYEKRQCTLTIQSLPELRQEG